MKRRKFKKFDMIGWEMGEDLDFAARGPAREFLENVTKLAESLADGLEGKFDNTVREGVEMALSFFARDPDYCGFSYSQMVTENNPDGVPSILFWFGDDYQDRETFTDFLDTCDNKNLDTLLELIAAKKLKRIGVKGYD